MIRRIADNDIEFHVEDLLQRFGVYELIGVALQFLAAVILIFAGATKHATTVLPSVLNTPEMDIALRVVEGLADGILPVGRLGAVNGPPRKQGGQLRDGESVELVPFLICTSCVLREH